MIDYSRDPQSRPPCDAKLYPKDHIYFITLLIEPHEVSAHLPLPPPAFTNGYVVRLAAHERYRVLGSLRQFTPLADL